MFFIIPVITHNKKRNKSVVQLSDGTFCKIMTLVAFKCEDGASSASTTNRFCVLAKECECGNLIFFYVLLNIC